MTKLDKFLAQVKSRLEKATPGPWSAYDWPTFPRQDEAEGCVRVESKTTITAFCFSDKPNHDALLIASAPTDIARLLTIVEKQNDVLRQFLRATCFHDHSDGSFTYGNCLRCIQVEAEQTLAKLKELCE